MKVRLFFTIAITIALTGSVLGQNTTLQKKYLSGKNLFNQERYKEAIEVLQPLTTYQNSFAEYATLYYALAADRSGQKEIGKNLLLQLIRKYPNWNKLEEAYYWLGKVYFDMENPDEALGYLNKIKNKRVKPDADALESHRLQEIQDQNQLLALHQKYPDDAKLGTALAQAIVSQPQAYQDTDLLASLIDQYHLDPAKIGHVEVGESILKSTYNVGVIFPFMIPDITRQQTKNTNQWVLDLYQGIEMGVDQLKTEGISIQLYAYDTKRDSVQTGSILSNDEMASMDLLIGPLYPVPSQLASGFALNKRINMVNPLSGNSQIISNNPFSFLYQPCYETQAQKAADFATKHFEKKRALIIYGPKYKDSVIAYTYQRALQEASFETILLDEISTRDSEEVSKVITQQIQEALSAKDGANISHIFVSSSEELVVANVVNSVHSLDANLAIIGHEDWLQFRYLDYEQLERLEVYMISPNYMDYESKNLKEFRKEYIETKHSLPNKYTYKGYDLMLFYGRLLDKYGTYFQKGLAEQEFIKGQLFSGFNYQNANDNQYVPIVAFDKGALTQVNQ